LIAASAAAALAAVLGGTVLYWQTPNGTVRIEVNDPDIEVVIDKDGPTVKGKDRPPITLRAGEHQLLVKRGDFQFETDKIILKKGQTVTVKIELLDGKVQVVEGDKVIGGADVGGPAKPPQKGPAKPPPQRGPLDPDFKSGPGDYALRFAGDGVVELPGVRWDRGRPFTLEAFATPSEDQGRSVIVSQGRNLSLEISRYRRSPTYLWSWQFPHNVGNHRALPNKRVHLAVVHEGKQVRLYVNGKLNGTREGIQLGGDDKIALFIGTGFRGVIDEVRLSQTARYAKDFRPAARFEPDADTVCLYHFDEGKGDVLKDASRNHLDGKIKKATWVHADGRSLRGDPGRLP
jgi:hypothetical protein